MQLDIFTPRKPDNSLRQTYDNMRQRCGNPKAKGWPRYGGRGITVCDAWAASYETFFRDVGPRPSPKHQLDRINNDDGYHPTNVRWVTSRENNRNRSNNRWVTHNGETLCVSEWAFRAGLTAQTLMSRLFQMCWPMEKALALPARAKRKAVKTSVTTSTGT